MADKDASGSGEGGKASSVRTMLVSGEKNGYWRKFNLCCQVCDRRFQTQFQLKQHVTDLKHYKEGQSYKCRVPECYHCFLGIRSRLQHERSKHKDFNFANPNPNPNPNPNNNNNIQPIMTKGMKKRNGDISQALPAVITEQYNLMIDNITKEIMKKVDVREKIESDRQKQLKADIENSNKHVEAELKKKFSKLHEEEIKSATDRKEREAAVVVKEKKLEEEVKKMKDLNEHTSEKIRLNVGGKYFLTTKSTLTKFSDSMLGTMFSGRHKIVIDKDDGSVFIDRSPKYFDQILSYLRDGEVFVPESAQDKYGLIKEADFYGLKGLADVISETIGEVTDDKDKKGKRKDKEKDVRMGSSALPTSIRSQQT